MIRSLLLGPPHTNRLWEEKPSRHIIVWLVLEPERPRFLCTEAKNLSACARRDLFNAPGRKTLLLLTKVYEVFHCFHFWKCQGTYKITTTYYLDREFSRTCFVFVFYHFYLSLENGLFMFNKSSALPRVPKLCFQGNFYLKQNVLKALFFSSLWFCFSI